MSNLDGYTYEMHEAEQERANRVRLRQQRAWEQADINYKEDNSNEQFVRVNSRLFGSFGDGREWRGRISNGY